MTSEKLGRNLDGTFTPGHRESVGNRGGRPTEDLSVRSQVKLRVSKNPKLMKKAIDNMFAILEDPKHPQFAKMLDTFVRLNGQYDAAEQKIEVNDNRNPFAGVDHKKLEQALNATKPKRTTSSQSSPRKQS